MNTAMIEYRPSSALWASCSIGLHVLLLVGFSLYHPGPIPDPGETTAKIRIFSNPHGLKEALSTPTPPQTQVQTPKINPSDSVVKKMIVPTPEIKKLELPSETKANPVPNPSTAASETTSSDSAPASFGDDRLGGNVGEGLSTTHGDDFDKSITQNLQPLKRVEPVYPREAALNGTEGWAVFSIDITESGEVENIKLVESYPSRVFERESRRALANWKYQPQVHNGKAQRIENHTVKIIFKLEG